MTSSSKNAESKNFESIHLIASNFVNLKSYLSYWTIKSIIILLTISVITGILHRIFLYLFQIIYNSNVFYAESALSNHMMMEPNPVDVSEEKNIETLVNLLKNDFGEDDSVILELYNNANETRRNEMLDFLRKKYTDIGKWAKRDYEIAFKHVDEVMKQAFGVTNKEIKKLAQLSTGKIRFFRYAFSIMLYISCGSFISALLVLAIAY